MNMKCILAAVLALASAQVLAVEPAPAPTVVAHTQPPTQAWLDHEVQRRNELGLHTSWQWSVAVVVQDKQDKTMRSGVLVGMQAQGKTGPIRSVGWLNTKGEPYWVGMQFPSDKGVTTWKFREGPNTAKWEDDPDGARFAASLRNALGFDVDVDTLNRWIVGATGDGQMPSSFATDEAGVHPVEALSRQGEIRWDGWSKIKTEKGFELTLPATWSVVGPRFQGLFQVASLEAYQPDELPVFGWPFVEKGSAFSLSKEAPIAKDEDLDYQSW